MLPSNSEASLEVAGFMRTVCHVKTGLLLPFRGDDMGSQHPSPNVKNLCNFDTQIWLEIITSRDAKSACFKGSQTSCTEENSGGFLPKFGRKKDHIT